MKTQSPIEHLPHPRSMRSCSLNMLSFNQNQYTHSFQPLQSYQQLIALTTNLQEVVMTQQMMLNTILAKQQQLEEKIQILGDRGLTGELFDTLQSQSLESNTLEKSGTGLDEKFYNNKQSLEPQIIRRNGFKSLKKSIHFKDNNSSIGSESLSDYGTPERTRRNPSKAKHLWVNYGRRIVDYVLTQTEGDMQEKVKKLTGRLNSKRDYMTAFGFTSEDTSEERHFKEVIGKLAVDFVKHKCATSFEGAKYKNQMIEQRHVVAAWIEQLISEEINVL